MFDKYFASNPTAWFIAFLLIGTILFLAVKYRFWLVILKVIVALLVVLILYFVLKPFLMNHLFDPQLIVDWFWGVTPNIWDDFYFEIDFALYIGLGIISIFLVKAAVKGKKRADPHKKPKITVEVE